jgi:hypothetical protein
MNARPAFHRPQIAYHAGPVLGTAAEGPVNLYLIFYGDWAGTDPGGPALMQDFAGSLQGSPYWNIFTTYNMPASIQNAITVAGTATDTGSQGTQLTDSIVQQIVQAWIDNGTFPADPNGIYQVLTSQEVTNAGFCSNYCAYHGNFSASNGADIKYAFIGNPAGCPIGHVAFCQGLTSNVTQSPNNDPGVDAMVSLIAHETGETTTDPDVNAWYFNFNGEEEGDICIYTYGKTYPLSNGSVYNVTLGGKNYLIQRSWIGPGGTGGAAGEKCALSYP